MIRPANESDLPLLYNLAKRFVAESELPFTFNLEAAHETLYRAIHDKNSILLIEYHEEDDVIGGGILGHVHRDFCDQWAAYVSKMYVEAEFRGIGTARELVEAFEVQAKLLGASVVFASGTAGMGERVEKLFVGLFKRFGYEVLGRIVVKEIN